MFRKLFVRLFLLVVALGGIIVLLVCLVGYLALAQPEFYAELRAHTISESDQLAAKAAWEVMERDLRLWCARELALQRTGLSTSNPLVAAKLDDSQSESHRAQETHSMTFTEQQINALLASSTSSGKQEWQHPRIHFRQGHADIGFELVTPQVSCVLSAKLKPTINSTGQLRLDLVSARIGRLPLPMRTIFGWLPRETYDAGNDVELNLNDPTPHMCVDLSSNAPESPRVKSIQCVEGEITIELLPPAPQGQNDQRRVTPLALSDVD